MNAADRENVRVSLLRFLAANRTDFGVPTTLLVSLARQEGRPWLMLGDTEAELVYLADKGLVVTVAKQVSPENRCWRIAAAGRDHLAERGLDQ